MSSEKYLNYYMEILTNTMTDAVIRNISLQANSKVTEEVLNEQAKSIDILKSECENIKNNKNEDAISKIENLEMVVKGHLDTIANLQNQLTELNKMKNEYENTRNQVSHIDTFRNELIKEREEHQKTRTHYDEKVKELSDQIEYLQLTPTKRKKIDDEKNKPVEVENVSTLPIDESIKDGGSF